MKIDYKIFKKKIFFAIIIVIANINSVNSEIIKKIEVSGNDRLSKETVILFSEFCIGYSI